MHLSQQNSAKKLPSLLSNQTMSTLLQIQGIHPRISVQFHTRAEHQPVKNTKQKPKPTVQKINSQTTKKRMNGMNTQH